MIVETYRGVLIAAVAKVRGNAVVIAFPATDGGSTVVGRQALNAIVDCIGEVAVSTVLVGTVLRRAVEDRQATAE